MCECECECECGVVMECDGELKCPMCTHLLPHPSPHPPFTHFHGCHILQHASTPTLPNHSSPFTQAAFTTLHNPHRSLHTPQPVHHLTRLQNLSCPPRSPHTLTQAAFKVLDADGDGAITQSDLEAFLPPSPKRPERAAAILTSAHPDNGTHVSVSCFEALMQCESMEVA